MKAKAPGESALLFIDIVNVFKKLRISYAVIGAFAASFYGVIRASIDVDAVISFKRGEERLLLDEFRKKGYIANYRQGDYEDPIGAVINIRDAFSNRVDLLAGVRGMMEDVFDRTLEADFMKTKVRMIGLEDFIAMKMAAGGPKDINDVMGVLEISQKQIDIPLLKRLTRHYGKKELKKLESLLKERTK